MLTRQLHRCLLTADKVESELRSRGYSSLEKVYAVVLEPNGAFAVITRGAGTEGAAKQGWHSLLVCCEQFIAPCIVF